MGWESGLSWKDPTPAGALRQCLTQPEGFSEEGPSQRRLKGLKAVLGGVRWVAGPSRQWEQHEQRPRGDALRKASNLYLTRVRRTGVWVCVINPFAG